MKDMIEREMYDVYIKDGIKYVPHYKNSSVYVGPGYRDGDVAYSGAYMEQSGAKKEQNLLWVRSNYGTVKNVLNPT
jgi:hypothetical protein